MGHSRAQERWTVMSRTPSEGGYGWLTIVDGPQIGQDRETFEVVRADVYQGAVDALEKADALADAVIRWKSHVALEGLVGEYMAARHAAGGR